MRTKVQNPPGKEVAPKTLLAQGMEMPWRGVMVVGIFDRASLPSKAQAEPNENFVFNYTNLTLDERIVLLKKANVFLDTEIQAALQLFDQGEIPNDCPPNDTL